MKRALFALTLLAACAAKTSPGPAPKPSSNSPTSPGDAAAAAQEACQTLRALGCKEAQPTPEGTPCEIWLAQAGQTPAGVSLSCLQKVTNCAETSSCRR